MPTERKRGRTIPPARPVALYRRCWGIEHELADGSIWRETPGGWWLVRLPTALNRAEVRQRIREEEPACAAAWAMPPARPAPLVQAPPSGQHSACGRCGSTAHTASISEPTLCIRCAAQRRRIVAEETRPAFVCARCGRDTIAPALHSPSVCVQCDRAMAAAAD